MTAISLLGIKIDSPPQQLSLSPELVLRLEAGVHLDLSDAPEDTLRAMARLLVSAARVKASQRVREVA